MPHNGWVRIHRGIMDAPFYNDLVTCKLAMHLLLTVNHKERVIRVDGKEIKIQRGQRIASFRSLGRELKVTQSKLKTSTVKLEKHGFMTRKPTHRFTLISIRNYDKFQKNDTVNDTVLPYLGEKVTQSTPKSSTKQECTKKRTKEIDVWEHYLLKTKKNYKLTADRRALIKKKLAEGYTVEQLLFAIDRFVEDEWEGRQEHMDLIYCIGKQRGKPDALDKWLNKPAKKKVNKYL